MSLRIILYFVYKQNNYLPKPTVTCCAHILKGKVMSVLSRLSLEHPSNLIGSLKIQLGFVSVTVILTRGGYMCFFCSNFSFSTSSFQKSMSVALIC